MAARVRFPLQFKKLVCTNLSQRFGEAVEIQTAQLTADSLSDGDIVVRNRFVGINASDINFTAGKCTVRNACMDRTFDLIDVK